MQGHMYVRIEAVFKITYICLLYVNNESEHVGNYYLSSID